MNRPKPLNMSERGLQAYESYAWDCVAVLGIENESYSMEKFHSDLMDKIVEDTVKLDELKKRVKRLEQSILINRKTLKGASAALKKMNGGES